MSDRDKKMPEYLGTIVILLLLIAILALVVKNKNTKEQLTDALLQIESLTASEETATEVQPETVIESVVPETPVEEPVVESEAGVDETTLSGNNLSKINWIDNYPATTDDITLADREATRSSYEETLLINAADKEIIANNKVDFSDVTIACIGDSLTEATNLGSPELSYPARLKEILGAKEVYNLGIGGSTVNRVGGSPMVERFGRIPDDVDIIIVFASTNDCLFENIWEFGFIEYDKRMTRETFCGDLDEMLGGINYRYLEHSNKFTKFFFVAPPSTVNNTKEKEKDGGLVDQSQYIKAIHEIAPQYKFDIIDMYNSNFLNSHDPDIYKNYMTDGVHGNEQAYYMMAERIAAEIIKRIE